MPSKTIPNVDLQKGERFTSLDGNFTRYRPQDEPRCTTRDDFFDLLPKTDGELVEDFWPKPHNAEATAKPDSDTTNAEVGFLFFGTLGMSTNKHVAVEERLMHHVSLRVLIIVPTLRVPCTPFLYKTCIFLVANVQYNEPR